MIEKLREASDSKTAVVMFRWQGINISLVGTLDGDGGKSLNVMAEGAGYVKPSVIGNKARWTMKKAASDPSGAGATVIYDGAVPRVIEQDMSK